MTVLLRAALVIGVLSYLALMRGGADPAAEARKLTGSLPSASAVLPAALEAIPPETRERATRAVLARGLLAELSRRAGEPAASTDTPSTDTLEAADRQPAWRGVDAR
ncbi:hypothetical protein SAMN05216360_11117 [Methylobacterium phyllostachyos]|uniref:Uncharacterized protein n=1 Tax=Methylobacterium phyllostachyos TaxID=582672 RepID=A0A1H0E1Z6_9HYPH|nr:hypothetical protein [Methylobacterium phyllostachyos]SDN76281.1 hypothetical protein SAMN05216360_11117 [Methylobacterium phyllostachyos]